MSKNMGGRPSYYDPSFCATIVEVGKNGGSRAEMAVACDTSLASFKRWVNDHEEFGEAYELAKTYSQSWWEKVGQNHIIETKDGDRVNPSLYGRSMSARFPDDWRDHSRTEITGKDGAPFEVNNIQSMSNIQLELLLEELRKSE